MSKDSMLQSTTLGGGYPLCPERNRDGIDNFKINLVYRHGGEHTLLI